MGGAALGSAVPLETFVRHALEGVGDATLGEWPELTDRAYHLRRRLTTEEAARIGPVRDVRGMPEAMRRFHAVQAYIPRNLRARAKEELVLGGT